MKNKVCEYLKSQFQVIAHRGFSAQYPENTLESFEMAIKQGATAIECDLYCLKDETIIIHHDDNLKRSAGLEIKTTDLSQEDLRRVKVFQDHPIPLLEELFSLTSDIAFNLELKTEGFTLKNLASLIRQLDQLKKKNSLFFLSSFNPHLLKIIKKERPDWALGVLDPDPSSGLWPGLAKDLAAVSYHPNQQTLNKESVADLKKENLLVFPYTINDSFSSFKSWGVDGVITNEVEAALGI